jgi:isoleucyl-tRNA synthetase
VEQYNHKKTEEEVLKFWKDKKIFEKLMKKNRGKKEIWSFIDGPITANNPMGVHHAWGRTYKDVYHRFKAMQGFDTRWQNGFDCQGLWLEVETEKELGFNSKKDIEHYGLERFSKACRARVEKFSKMQANQSTRLGQWMDWNDSYYTMSDKNIEYIWYFLKKCKERGWLYKGTKVLPWCTRCGTSSSQHEMSDEGYKELTHPAVYVRAKIKGKDREYLLLWTTTEWTLSSNVAAAVNPDLNYVKAQKGGDTYYLSEATAKKIGGFKIAGKIKGRVLVGMEYESFYPDFEVQEGVRHKVVAWKDVGEEEGTGIVHIAPTCGAEDYELGVEKKLALIRPALDSNGIYNSEFGWLSGKMVFDVKKKIVEDLEKRGILFKIENYTHRYPVCWRCGAELVFRMDSGWFISCKEIRPLMKEAAKKVKWRPEHIGKLMQDWLDNMGDWNISRKRYWGLPLMFFECECGHTEIISSREELKKKAVNPKDVDELPELHRPWIDEIRIRCPKCKKEVSRIPEVGDCWLDAGIVPFSTLKYLEDKKYWGRWFPAEMVTEMRAQVRLWFYSLLFMAITLEGKSPYKSVFAYEVVNDERGESMHKSKGNAIWFDDAVEKMGVDIMRWLYCVQNPATPLKFGYTPAKDALREIQVIWNLGNYVQMSCKNRGEKYAQGDIHKWILSRRETTKNNVANYLDGLKPNLAIAEVRNFLINDLSRTYGQMIRGELENPEVQKILYDCFLDGITMLGVFLPFFTEKMYLELGGREESLFLQEWPKPNSKMINDGLEEEMESAKVVMQNILAEREKAGIGVRWPVAKAVVYLGEEKREIRRGLLDAVKKYANVKVIETETGESKVELDTRMTKELEREGFTREVIRRVQDLRKKAGLKKEQEIILEIKSDVELDKELILNVVGAKKIGKVDKPQHKDKFTIRDRQFEIEFKVV